MKVPLLDLKPQYAALKDEFDTALAEVFDSQRFIMGPAVPELEEAIARYCGVDHAIACASGTDAVLLALMALDLQPGDEVITTPFTFFATAGAIVNAGGRPVFVDIDPATLNIDVTQVEAAVGPRTRAVIPVHIFGQMVPMKDLVSLGDRTGIMILEDAAQAIGARQKNGESWQRAGSFGTVASFSFFPSKNLGAWGDGGMMVTNDTALADKLRLLRTHGGAKQYHHEIIGTNSRLDTVQATVLNVKLPHLEGWSAKRREHAATYDMAFSSLDNVTPVTVLPENEPIYHQYTVRAERRDELSGFLKDREIGNAVYYPVPLHRQACFADLGQGEGSLPVSEQAVREVVSLPVYPEMSPEGQNAVIETIGEFYQ